jgi:multidrug efflux pump subunit AcrB
MRASSLLALTASLFAASLYAGDTQRFSQSLTAEQRTTAGIDQLNSDQVAALDALVRLDAHQAAAATKKAAATASKPAAGMAVKLATGANALSTADAVRAKLEELSKFYPKGMKMV